MRLAHLLEDMEPCADCSRAETNPRTARFTATCLECSARALAQSPLYFESSRGEAMTPEYRAALEAVFGEDVRQGHDATRAWANRILVATLQGSRSAAERLRDELSAPPSIAREGRGL